MSLPKDFLLLVTVLATLGCGLIGGLLFAFSSNHLLILAIYRGYSRS